MNISLQICGLVIAVFLLILYKSHATLGLSGEKHFVVVILSTIICLALDALSVIGICYRGVLPVFLVKLICKAYLISMIWVGWSNFCYVMLDLNSDNKSHSLLVKRTKLMTAAASIITAALPIHIYNEGDELYTFGPSVIATYVFVLFYIISTLIVAIYIRRKKNSRRGTALIMATSLWILAAAIQMLNNALLVVGFAMAVGIMILYVVMENPDSNLDRQLGCFNSHAMQNYLTMCLESGAHFHVLDLSLTDVKALETWGVDVAAAAKRVIANLESVSGIKVFKNMNTGLLLVSEDAEKLEEASRKIMEIVTLTPGASNSVTMFLVRNADQFPTAGELMKFLTYVRSQGNARLSAIVHVSDGMIRQYNQAKEIEAEIDLALSEDRVEVFLQPVCDAGGVPFFAEALVRIRQKDGGMLSPGLFIPVAEATGQVKELGERVLEKVCIFLRDTEVLSLGLRMVDVNLSAVQCDDSAMAGRLLQITEKCGISPKYISYEITETAVSNVKDTLIENMNALVSKGFCFALDDFGKGESNLMYIVEMPCQIIKLDLDMTKAYFKNPKARPVVEAIVAMAKQLNLTTIAEGVETQEEAEGISALGIDYIQGYYFSRPLPMSDFLEFMHRNGRIAEEEPATQAEAAEVPAAEEDELDSGWLASRHILLVEDNEMNREIAQEILEDYGFTVDAVEDGTFAVEKMRDSVPGQYGIVLMDIRMPMMNGYEATRRIRQLEDPALASVPIIALTSQDTEEDRRASYEAGMNGHLCKPLDAEKLKSLIADLARV